MSLTERVAGARTGKVPNVLVQGIWLVGLLPAKEKKCGSAVGFIGVVGVEYETWLISQRTPETLDTDTRTVSRIRRGNETDAVMEFIAAIAFERLSGGKYIVLGVRLTSAPILNEFTQDNEFAVEASNDINVGRSTTQRIDEAVHVASRWCVGTRTCAILSPSMTRMARDIHLDNTWKSTNAPLQKHWLTIAKLL